MVEAGTQRKNIQILTGIGFIISIGLLIFFKQHPTYFKVPLDNLGSLHRLSLCSYKWFKSFIRLFLVG